MSSSEEYSSSVSGSESGTDDSDRSSSGSSYYSSDESDADTSYSSAGSSEYSSSEGGNSTAESDDEEQDGGAEVEPIIARRTEFINGRMFVFTAKVIGKEVQLTVYNKEENAAKDIQRIWRGWRMRKAYKLLLSKMKSECKALVAMERLRGRLTQAAAATMIQAAYRGHAVRRKIKHYRSRYRTQLLEIASAGKVQLSGESDVPDSPERDTDDKRTGTAHEQRSPKRTLNDSISGAPGTKTNAQPNSNTMVSFSGTTEEDMIERAIRVLLAPEENGDSSAGAYPLSVSHGTGRDRTSERHSPEMQMDSRTSAYSTLIPRNGDEGFPTVSCTTDEFASTLNSERPS